MVHCHDTLILIQHQISPRFFITRGCASCILCARTFQELRQDENQEEGRDPIFPRTPRRERQKSRSKTPDRRSQRPASSTPDATLDEMLRILITYREHVPGPSRKTRGADVKALKGMIVLQNVITAKAQQADGRVDEMK